MHITEGIIVGNKMAKRNPQHDCGHKPGHGAEKSAQAFLADFLFDTGDSILLVEPSFVIVAANARTGEVFLLPSAGVIGRDSRRFFAEPAAAVLNRVLPELKTGESWAGELRCLRSNGEIFPADVTIKQLTFHARPLFFMVIRDLSEYETLRQMLRQEKSHRREMYITLRNLMNAFEAEKKGLEGDISHKIETVLLPAIEKIRNESDPEIRESYLDILREQLVKLTKGFSRELDGRLLRLSRSEIRVCQLIQEGLSGKEIAETINVSFETVQTHRRNIRKKLGLTGRKISLHTMLSTRPLFRSRAGR